jgi:SAM-dependent methyltransferase
MRVQDFEGYRARRRFAMGILRKKRPYFVHVFLLVPPTYALSAIIPLSHVPLRQKGGLACWPRAQRGCENAPHRNELGVVHAYFRRFIGANWCNCGRRGMTHDLEKAKAFYDGQVGANLYVDYGGRTNIDAVRVVLRPHLNADRRVLDLGCGDGGVALNLLQAVPELRYVGVEATPSLAKLFNEKKLNAKLHEADATDLLNLFPETKFHIILCLFLLQDLTVDCAKRILKDMRKLLTDNGVMLLGLTVHPDESSVVGEEYRPKAFSDKKKNINIPGKYTYLWGRPDLDKELDSLGYRRIATYEELTPNLLWESYWLFKVTRIPD